MKNYHGGALALLIVMITALAAPFSGEAQNYRRITVNVGDATPDSSATAPFYNSKRHAWVQTIYTSTQIGHAGYIDTLWYYCAQTVSTNLDTAIKIYMAHTTMTVATANNAWIPLANLTQVRTTASVQPRQKGWFAIPLSTAFYYNGEDNLAICISRHGSANNASQRYRYIASQNGAVLYRGDNRTVYGDHPGNNTGTMDICLPAIRLSINEEYYNCPKPIHLTQTWATDSSIAFDWNPQGGGPQWLMVIKADGDSTGDTMTLINHPDTIGGLQPNSAYRVTLTTLCAGADSSFTSRELTVRTDCQKANGLDTTEVHKSYAWLTWQGRDGDYVVAWCPQGDTSWRYDTTAARPARIGGLIGDTTYMAVIKGACESNGWNDTLLFRTQPGVDSFPVIARSNNNSYGSVTGGGILASDDTITITATANPNHRFLHWDDGRTDNPRVFRVIDTLRVTAIFVPDTYTVSLQCLPAGSATLSGDGRYAYNESVTISALANYGYHFRIWSDSVARFLRTINVTSDSQLTAIMQPNTYQLTVRSADSTMGNTTGTGSYDYLTHATIEAIPSTGYHFLHWNDGNTDNPRDIEIRRDIQFTAIFAIDTYAVAILSADTSQGSASGSGLYTYRRNVTITATPSYGYHFAMWSDSSTTNPRTIVVTSDDTLYAIFKNGVFQLEATAAIPGRGDVVGQGSFDYGDTTTLTAIASHGYHFTMWSDSNTLNPRPFTIMGDTTLLAIFEPNTYRISALCDTVVGGVITGPDSALYLEEVSLAVTSNHGYTFSSWADGDTSNPRLITVNGDTSLTALFTPNRYFISVTSSPDSLGATVGMGYHNYDADITLSALAMPHYHFTTWSDGDTSNPRIITVKGDSTFTAAFAIDTHVIVIASTDPTMGSMNATGRYTYGSTATLIATANYGYHFTSWSDGNPNNPRTITVTSDSTFYAHFAMNNYTVTVQSSDLSRGTTSGSGVYAHLASAILSAIPLHGYSFTAWNDGDTTNPRTITVSCDTTLTASFAPRSYHLTGRSDNQQQGSVNGSGTYDYNTQASLTAVPATHYHFLRWTDGQLDNPRTITVLSDTTFIAQFEIDHKTVVALSADSVMGIATGSGSYSYSSTATLTARPNPGYIFTRWNDGNTDNPRTITVTDDTVFTASFATTDYTITVRLSNDGAGNTMGTGTYSYGTLVTIQALTSRHYSFVRWNDGNTDNPRVIEVQRDAVYIATVVPDTMQIYVVPNDGQSGTVTGSGRYVYGTNVTATAIPNAGFHFVRWGNGASENPYTFAATANITLIAIFDRDGEGIDESSTATPTEVFASNRHITIRNAQGRSLRIYDAMGRLVTSMQSINAPETTCSVPAAGVYLVQIDGTTPRKVVVL